MGRLDFPIVWTRRTTSSGLKWNQQKTILGFFPIYVSTFGLIGTEQ